FVQFPFAEIVDDRFGIDVALLGAGSDEPATGTLTARPAKVGEGDVDAFLPTGEPAEGDHDPDDSAGDEKRNEKEADDQLDGCGFGRRGKLGLRIRAGFGSLQIGWHQEIVHTTYTYGRKTRRPL